MKETLAQLEALIAELNVEVNRVHAQRRMLAEAVLAYHDALGRWGAAGLPQTWAAVEGDRHVLYGRMLAHARWALEDAGVVHDRQH